GEACHSDGDPAALRLRFPEPDPPQLAIGEHAIRNEPIASRPWAPRQMVAHHAEVVIGDMGELRAPRTFAHRPHAACCRLQAITYLDVAARVQFDSRTVETDVARVGRAPGGDE